jgi:hypothetical protein
MGSDEGHASMEPAQTSTAALRFGAAQLAYIGLLPISLDDQKAKMVH